MQQTVRQYIAIDLKSFYASVECVDRGLDPLTTNLVVADKSRTEKTICLAVTPSLKSYGISGRARLFEVVQRVNEVNHQRSVENNGNLRGASYNDKELKAHPELRLDYIVATPRMSHYLDVSAKVHKVYLKYIAPEDMHVYSVDEVFIDATAYLKSYKMTAHELAMTMIRDVLRTTGITATAGIGTNLYLCKIAMDIVAKHIPADKDGVRIAELDEMSYRKTLWDHKPLTSFWRIGHGTAYRLGLYGIDTMGKLARMSIENEALLHKLFGIHAELLIDHAWGYEPCTMEYIKAYRPTTHSLNRGQVLKCPYDFTKARIVVQEMAGNIALLLVEKRMVTNQLALCISYDTTSLKDQTIRTKYSGEVRIDHYGRQVPKHANGTTKLGTHTSSSRMVIDAIMALYDKIVNPDLLVRRINISANNIIDETEMSKQLKPVQLDLFIDYEEELRKKEEEQKMLAKERRIQEAQLAIKKRFGKNAILNGISFAEGATAKERNMQIGGQKE